MKILGSKNLIAACCAIAFCAPLFGQSAQAQTPVKPEPTVDQRIEFYSKKLEQHPRLFVVHTQLAAAYLDKARADLNPKWLKLAEQSLNQSLKIYANFDAYKGLEIMNAYRHRFAEARRWGEIAYKLAPDDYEVLAVLVEADLGLGDIDTATKRLQTEDADPRQFHVVVAKANIAKAKHQYVEARNLFLKAEQLAHEQGYPYLALWSRTNAGGMLIDSGHAKEARADLEAATKIRKGDPILRLHWAEYDEAVGAPEKALSILNSMLEDASNPSFHYRAYRLAKKLGYEKEAQMHYAATEKGYLLPLEQGEIYSLGSLAELYCAADTHLDKALAMATRNLEYKRDDEAQFALKCVKDKLAANTKK